ncbi:MAG: Unknown protein [uncultured Sulfurovum sp.]|uniref:ATPase AAA-type core domain-containing protein n=1 Tax=uncultured Sulfurovum sp. TaxID=269237 RepID=A0A6S6TNA9_9BACT|nr:MAG: Unknown protein [uncultured Sulfurovum sp.]
MIEKIHIQNFKSIYDLELEVGRVNLFIGENGSGKSNLLEALVFVSASESNMLANEFLVSRGLRVPEPELMRSAFNENINNIKMKIQDDNDTINYEFKNDNKPYSKWSLDFSIEMQEQLDKIITERYKCQNFEDFAENVEMENILKSNNSLFLKNFIIYSPENMALRVFEKEGQVQPLGINGQGLLKLLKVINNYKDQSYIKTIIESLQLFNWFENIEIPTNISSGEDKVIIKDKYLYREMTQGSANEGFLFILFYITLIVAKETPKAFAIDNIDASLNPKLCTKLMTILTELAQKYDKQIFLTTHNPAILDGIDLNDKEQKIFVVSRNKKGHTRRKEITIEDKPKSSDDEALHLSEAFMRGYLGGLPKGF